MHCGLVSMNSLVLCALCTVMAVLVETNRDSRSTSRGMDRWMDLFHQSTIGVALPGLSVLNSRTGVLFCSFLVDGAPPWSFQWYRTVCSKERCTI